MTTILFDHEVQLLHDRFPLKAVAPLTEKDYYVRGCTALLDAIGYGMEKMVNIQRHLPEDERAEKVIFVITTDGLENASKRFGYEKIRRMIEREKERYGWEFCSLVPTWMPCKRPPASVSEQTGRCGSRTMPGAWQSTTMCQRNGLPDAAGRLPGIHRRRVERRDRSRLPEAASGVKEETTMFGSNFRRYGRQPLRVWLNRITIRKRGPKRPSLFIFGFWDARVYLYGETIRTFLRFSFSFW